MPKENYQDLQEAEAFTIAAAGSLSPAIDLYGTRPHALQMPAAWDTASLTFQASYDGTTFANVYKGGSEYTVAVDADQFVILDPVDFAGIRHLKIRSGTSGTPVAQTLESIIYFIIGPV